MCEYHTACGGDFPSRAVQRAIRSGTEYDPATGVPAGVITIVVPHPAWGWAYKAVGFEPCPGPLMRSHAE